jgi:hypothetical protein
MKEFLSKEFKLGCVLSPIYIPLGIAISFIVLAIVTLDISTAFAILAFSIICTAGISLIIWIPVWYILGYLAFAVLRFILSFFGVDLAESLGLHKKKNKPAPQAEQPTLSRDQQALLNYIKKAQAKGLSNAQISSNLQNNGWSRDSITWAFNFMGGQGAV